MRGVVEVTQQVDADSSAVRQEISMPGTKATPCSRAATEACAQPSVES